MDWLVQNYKEILAVLVSLGAVSGTWSWFHTWRARRLEERRAAAALIPTVTKYKLHWIAKHFDELNAEFDPNERIQWGGDKFEPVLSSPALEGIASRLSKSLRRKVHAVEALSHKWRTDIAEAYEFDSEDIDIIGLIAVAELALASDELLKALATEAQVPDPATGHSTKSIRERLEGWREDRRKWDEAQEKANREFWESASSGRQPS